MAQPISAEPSALGRQLPFSSLTPLLCFLFCSQSLETPVAYGTPLHSAAQSGPATLAVLSLSPLQQARCPALASWAQRTLLLMPLQPPVQLMIWDRPTTHGGYGALQLEEEALTRGLIRTSLMKIEIRKKKSRGSCLDHDLPVSETSF